MVENAHELKQLQRRGVFANGERFCLKSLETLRQTPFIISAEADSEDTANVPSNEGQH